MVISCKVSYRLILRFTCYSVINKAYDIETGDSGVAFKRGKRMDVPLDDYFLAAYNEGRMFVVIEKETGSIVGATYWHLTDCNTIYFGPFAVRPDMQGRKIGKMMINEIERIGREKGVEGIDIRVVNWRTDLIPWYESLGYQQLGTSQWPSASVQVLTRPSHFVEMRRSLD